MTNDRLQLSIEKLNHFILIFFVPILGVLIPLFTGLLNDTGLSIPYLLYGYFYCIILSFLIWKGNLFLLSLTGIKNTRTTFFSGALMTGFTVTILYTLMVSYIMLIGLNELFFNHSIPSEKIQYSVMVMVVVSLFGQNLYQVIVLRHEKLYTEKRARNLELAKKHAEFTALKMQVDPHFIFNALNTLSYLSESDPEKARQCIGSFADLYRYILEKREQDKVWLWEELAFVEDYIRMQQMKYGNSIVLVNRLSDIQVQRCRVIPLALQLLVENAIKHNMISKDTPLYIELFHDKGHVVVRNSMNLQTHKVKSTGIGLHNLCERYKIVFGKIPQITVADNQFTVQIPV